MLTLTPDATASSSPPGDMSDRFGELLRRVKERGLLDRQPAHQAVHVLANLGLLTAGWIVFVAVGSSWWTLAAAVLLALAYTQTGFIGHDIGHRQVARSRRIQDLLGLLHGNLLLGFSYGWWVGHHNKHHAYPNHLEKDSDITRRRVIFLPEQGPTREGRPKQFIVRHQHLLFYPLLLTEGIGLRVASFKALREQPLKHKRAEAALIGVHLVAYSAAVLLVLPPTKALAFFVVHQLLFGLHIGSVFAPNHKGMPIQRPGEEWDWMTRQVITSRNLRSTRLVDFVYGGLNYQIEHHLFPTMPRRNLRKARPITKAYCAEIGMPYHEVSVLRSFADVVGHLRRTTRAYQASYSPPAA